MFTSSGIEPEIVEQSEVVEFLPGLDLPIAQMGHLIALKVLAARPQDVADLDRLLRVAGCDDIELAKESARLIVQRGTNRRKDLESDLARAICDSRPGRAT